MTTGNCLRHGHAAFGCKECHAEVLAWEGRRRETIPSSLPAPQPPQPLSDLLATADRISCGAVPPPRPQWSLLPASIAAVVDVLTWGVGKYPNNDGRLKSLDEQYDSLMRHVMSWRAGEKLDSESGREHLAHAAARILFMIELEKTKGESK